MHGPPPAPSAISSTSPESKAPSSMNHKMGQAYLEQSIAELESQLREVRLTQQQQQQQRRACLLDISMLVYGLPVVKKWARSDEYAEFLLPIDGQSVTFMPRGLSAKYITSSTSHFIFHTCYNNVNAPALTMLDVLKKVEQPLCSQAREAIRWLEWQLESNNEVSSSRPQQRQNSRSRVKLRVLSENDMIPWSHILEESLGSLTSLHEHSDEELQMRKESLRSLSFGRQTTVRALWSCSSKRVDVPVVAFTTKTYPDETQPDLVKRLLLDPEPLAQSLQKCFPFIPLDTLLHVSSKEVSKAAEDEAAFRSMRQSRSEQADVDTSRKARLPQGRSNSERQRDRPDSGFQRSRTRTPNSSRSSERSPASQPHTPTRSPPVTSSAIPATHQLLLHKSSSYTTISQPRQPRILQNQSRSGQTPSQNASVGVVKDNTRLEKYAAPSRPQREVTKVQPLPTAKITLANPRSTARSLSTAT